MRLIGICGSVESGSAGFDISCPRFCLIKSCVNVCLSGDLDAANNIIGRCRIDDIVGIVERCSRIHAVRRDKRMPDKGRVQIRRTTFCDSLQRWLMRQVPSHGVRALGLEDVRTCWQNRALANRVERASGNHLWRYIFIDNLVDEA